MFDLIASPQFNAAWKPGGADVVSGSADNGLMPQDYDYKGAFTGLGNLSAARMNGDGTYSLGRTFDGANQYQDETSTATIGPGGSVSTSPWARREVDSNAKSMMGAAGLFAAGFGGLGLAGFGPAAGLFGGGAAASAAPAGGGVGAGAGAGSGAAGFGAQSLAAPAFNAAVDSQLASSALGLSGLGGGAATAASAGGGGGFLSSLGGLGGGGGGLGGALSSAGGFLKDNGSLLNLGGNLLSGYLGSKASGDAANAQMAAGREANQLQKYFYDTTRSDNAPLLQTRNSALANIQGLLANPKTITSDPGFQFGMDQGQQAIDRSATSRGGLYSGATLKALDRFGNDYGQTKLNESFNRNTAAAGLGQAGANNNLQAGMNYTNNAANNITGMGNASASSYIGKANAWGDALGNAFNAWQDDSARKKFPG